MSNFNSVCVLGGGNFGTVIANVLAENGYPVKLWVRRQELADEINTQHENKSYLVDINLHENLKAETDLASCVKDMDVVVMAIPSKSVRSVAQQVKPFLKSDAVIVSTTKGIEAPHFKLMSEVLNEELAGHEVLVLSGPNISREIAEKQLSASVIAHPDLVLCEKVAQVLHSSYLRIYPNPDRYGVELAGALKNIYAIMSGFVEALGLGYNTKSMLMTRSLAEMSRMAVQLGANPMTFLGLAGVGDLLVTCMSPVSRNFRVGFALGQGKTLDEAVEALGQVAEGVNTLKTVKQKSVELDVYMPLVDALHALIFEGKSLEDLISNLMEGDRNIDVSFVLK